MHAILKGLRDREEDAIRAKRNTPRIVDPPLAEPRDQRVHPKEAKKSSASIEKLDAMIQLVGNKEATFAAVLSDRDIAGRTELPGIDAHFSDTNAALGKRAIRLRREVPKAIREPIGHID